MPRADLLALTPDDLAALTNRGTVKRAQRELDANEVAGTLKEEGGTITATWSDGAKCILPAGAVVADARCTCPATELCRHVVRTVLAYQTQSAGTQPAGDAGPWNPGDVSDAELAKHFKPAALTIARTQFEKGLLVELVKGEKPSVRFHDLACTLRFQVRGDVRYVHCDCAAAPPCGHVPLAVWAFRRLPPDKTAAILSTQEKPLPVPTTVLDRIDEVLLDGLELGLAGGGTAWRDRLSRLEVECRDAGLIWPAEVVLEIVHQFEQYAAHDARFSPDRYAELVGELLIRADAIRSNTAAVPQLLVRGTASDHWADLGPARFVGLGCGVRTTRRAASLFAFLQDADSGSVVAVSREFADPPEGEEPRAFWQLAQTPVLKGATFAQVGAGQLLTTGGRRAADHQLVLGRTRATVNPQNFSWENLRAPVFAESFAEVRARLGVLPPSSLRPRRVAEDFHVCPAVGVESAAFDAASQTVRAVLKDARGDLAILSHPFTSRGAGGAERLLARLTASPQGVRFVAGPMRVTAEGLRVEPVAVVVQDEAREVLQPWIDRGDDTRGDEDMATAAEPPDAVREFRRELLAAVGQLLLVGLRRADANAVRSWGELARLAEGLGVARLGRTIGRVVAGLAARSATARWDARPTAGAVLELAALVRFAQDIGDDPPR